MPAVISVVVPKLLWRKSLRPWSNRGLRAGVDSPMTVRSQLLRVLQQEDINFLLTNRIPRRLATQLIGWFSRIEQPLVRDVSIGVWQLFSDLDLREAKKTHFRSMHDCFTRELKDGARPIDSRAGYSGQSLRRHRRRLRHHRRHRALPGQGLPLHAGGPARRSRAGRGASQRPLCHAAADVQHVPPLPCAA